MNSSGFDDCEVHFVALLDDSYGRRERVAWMRIGREISKEIEMKVADSSSAAAAAVATAIRTFLPRQFPPKTYLRSVAVAVGGWSVGRSLRARGKWDPVD